MRPALKETSLYDWKSAASAGDRTADLLMPSGTSQGNTDLARHAGLGTADPDEALPGKSALVHG
jgi:hypothetical protein